MSNDDDYALQVLANWINNTEWMLTEMREIIRKHQNYQRNANMPRYVRQLYFLTKRALDDLQRYDPDAYEQCERLRYCGEWSMVAIFSHIYP